MLNVAEASKFYHKLENLVLNLVYKANKNLRHIMEQISLIESIHPYLMGFLFCLLFLISSDSFFLHNFFFFFFLFFAVILLHGNLYPRLQSSICSHIICAKRYLIWLIPHVIENLGGSLCCIAKLYSMYRYDILLSRSKLTPLQSSTTLYNIHILSQFVF